jgi:hypothetical protein
LHGREQFHGLRQCLKTFFRRHSAPRIDYIIAARNATDVSSKQGAWHYA